MTDLSKSLRNSNKGSKKRRKKYTMVRNGSKDMLKSKGTGARSNSAQKTNFAKAHYNPLRSKNSSTKTQRAN